MKLLNELIGKKIVRLRPMTKNEREDEGWENHHSATSVIELEGGILIYPSSDDEGNGAGTLFGKDGKERFYIYSKNIIDVGVKK